MISIQYQYFLNYVDDIFVQYLFLFIFHSCIFVLYIWWLSNINVYILSKHYFAVFNLICAGSMGAILWFKKGLFYFDFTNYDIYTFRCVSVIIFCDYPFLQSMCWINKFRTLQLLMLFGGTIIHPGVNA